MRHPNPEVAEERAGHDGGHGSVRRVLAVGKRVKNRWLVEMSPMSRPVAPPQGVETRSAQAA